MTEFVPTFAQATPSKLTSKPWLSSEEPQVLLFQGMRGSGKGVSVDQTAEWLYNQGLTILHIWGARSLENLFWSVNLNCKEKYEKLLNKPKFIVSKFFEKSGGSLEERCLENNLNPFTSVEDYESEIQTSIEMGFIREDNEGKFELLDKGYDLHDGNLLHCKCHKAYPILLIVPNYIEFEKGFQGTSGILRVKANHIRRNPEIVEDNDHYERFTNYLDEHYKDQGNGSFLGLGISLKNITNDPKMMEKTNQRLSKDFGFKKVGKNSGQDFFAM